MAPDPLPVAANHAALSNRISLLLSAQTSFIKTLNPRSTTTSTKKNSSKSSTTTTTTDSPHNTQADKDDEELFKNNARPNEGVGYIPPKTSTTLATDKNKEDRELRGRILGKRGAQIVADRKQLQMQQQRKKKQQEESEDEDLGRSALGKRKRPRREVQQEEAQEEERVDEPAEEKEEEKEEVVKDEDDGDAAPEADVEMQDTTTIQGTPLEQPPSKSTSTTKRNKNKKKKNKAKPKV